MTLGLRQKLVLGFGGLLAFLLVVGALCLALLTTYSSTIEKIFRENYDSVVYGQRMKEAGDALDTLAQQTLWVGGAGAALDLDAVARAVGDFEDNLSRERHNITLAAEQTAVAGIETTWTAYRAALAAFGRADLDAAGRRRAYTERLRPLEQTLTRLAQRVIDVNLANMVSVDGQVKERTNAARRTMYALLVGGVLLAVSFTAVTARAILRPLAALTDSAREIARGNLDLSVHVDSRDELGRLGEAFNSMAAKLREFRRSDRARYYRVQKTTQLALNSFPDAVVVVGLDGKVELANDAAQERFGLHPGADLAKTEPRTLWDLFQRAYADLVPAKAAGYAGAIQVFDRGDERFYLPQAVPIIGEDKVLAGVTLLLADVTSLRRLDEVKSGLLSVVSHELKTPLTSIRMATHLLLEERVGPLQPKQVELLIAARDDAERLNQIIQNLLDIGRIESGRDLMERQPAAAEALVARAVDAVRAEARDHGIQVRSAVEGDLPPVLVDLPRIAHVFSNLLGNALKYTAAGGAITVAAGRDGDAVRFTVTDTGIGIPEDCQAKIFERFFRVPGSPQEGVGLGLAIAREIVEAHGGKLWLASTPVGEGSAFAFTLQAAPEGAAAGQGHGGAGGATLE